ncbi:hypothetical protein, partial [Mesorhizobium sp. M8A.F.Ca.ET.198.01.1.1]|uniref:hypothetical protein n=1 Tax=Mesorhizobium sp. M8A.F.Ca.ET.198.01.1.1 TaxID=2563966 RepID=UPI001FE097E8
REQKPRSALSDERYQRRVDDANSLISAEPQAAMTAKFPLVRVHCVQWQAMSWASSPALS